MPKRMLIDASHPEETRVVVLDGQKVEEFDFEAATKRPLKGNIYLAKVTRVEPSLQAAFVEYGGNRQGFLAFSEIHPDYYQIPVADRMALLAEQQEEARRHAEEEFESVETMSVPAHDSAVSEDDGDSDNAPPQDHHEDRESRDDDSGEHEDGHVHEGRHREEDDSRDTFENHPEEAAVPDHALIDQYSSSGEPTQEASAAGSEAPSIESTVPSENGGSEDGSPNVDTTQSDVPDNFALETGSSSGSMGEDFSAGENSPQSPQPLQSSRPPQRWARKRHYKIQEVIKRRQIILVQVVKEERGNKGAALTTYLSLAGRYCVLMPNTPRGGGISRKITNANDRKRLKSAVQALELPEGMGLIIRTAGENRTKVEIKRDYEYLLRMWDTIRELTLKSNAPACVYEEGDLIKRAIRDLYNKDVAEIIVEGDDGYRNAKDFMRMLMPSHAKNVKPYKEPVPLFQRHHIEAQLDAMFSPTVTLKSGGYIVINQTEALVSVDVNSGRATREHSIEETAHKTNLEAADEIGRQLRLRDLAGLIVIDFIDMEDGRNDRNVEKRIRDAVKNDRARIQIGKISQFGLLEMSRQRLRAGVIAGSTVPCPHCGGQGIVRSVESTALRVLRALDEEGQRQRANTLIVRVTVDVAVYTLNQKRRELARIESDNGVLIQFEPKEGVVAGNFEIERIGQRAPDERPKLAPPPEPVFEPEEIIEEDADEIEAEEAELEGEVAGEERSHQVPQQIQAEPRNDGQPRGDGQPQGEGGKRRRRRRRRGRDRDRPAGAPENGGAPVNAPQQFSEGGFAAPAGSDLNSAALLDALHEPRQDGAQLQGPQSQSAQSPGTLGEGGRRKRRRRRRGRGPREGQPVEGQSSEGQSFNVNDAGPERLESGPANSAHQDTIEHAASHETAHEVIGSGINAPIVTPNAPSAPVWSLAQHTPEQTSAPIERKIEAPSNGAKALEGASVAEVAPIASRETLTPQAVAPQATDQPAKKGWWQRPFRLRD
jgi:ribonuclease E